MAIKKCLNNELNEIKDHGFDDTLRVLENQLSAVPKSVSHIQPTIGPKLNPQFLIHITF